MWLWLSSLRSVRRLAATRYGGPRGAAWAAWALSFAACASAKWTAAMFKLSHPLPSPTPGPQSLNLPAPTAASIPGNSSNSGDHLLLASNQSPVPSSGEARGSTDLRRWRPRRDLLAWPTVDQATPLWPSPDTWPSATHLAPMSTGQSSMPHQLSRVLNFLASRASEHLVVTHRI
jgi:hypothetical protein